MPAHENDSAPPADSTVAVSSVGECLGPYRIASKLAQTQFIERFQREARAISSLNHPHICTLHDVGPNYLVMELVDGETIAARLKSGPLPATTVLLYASQIAAALAEAHDKGIVHRDVKPGNIMIARS